MRRTALRAMVTALVTGLVIATLTALPAAPAQAGPWEFVFIANRPAGTCLAGDSPIPSEQPCVDSNYHMWTLREFPPGKHRIQNTATGQCLAAVASVGVQQQTCGTGTAQQWILTASGAETNAFTISDVGSHGCIYRQGGGAIGLGSCRVTVARWHLLF